MKLRGSEIVVAALEDAGARFTFGIPGTHNIELYDALDESAVLPVLVTDEQGASFMADGVSRSSDTIGVVNVVPGAGVTHCLSGVAEAFMDNVPLVVLACGIRRDTDRAFQLHDIDQAALLAPITKAVLRPESADEIYRLVRRAFDLARRGAPGPVAIEIPAHFYMLTQDIDRFTYDASFEVAPPPAPEALDAAADLLGRAPWREQIASGHRDVREAWGKDRSDGRVTPAAFFSALQRLAPHAIYTTDSGNGTFLAMEHLLLDRPGQLLAPVDYSCMGYSVPAASS